MAAAVRLMDLGALRIGSDGYERRNGSFGLTTLRCKHVQVSGDTVSLHFPGKSGQAWESTIEDPPLARFLKPLADRPGKQPLLAFNEGSGWASLDAAMVNEYLRHITGGDYTAKDFRTWKGTAAAGMALAGRSKVPDRQRVLEAIKQTAELLGNTPTVARAAYVDPRIVEGFLAGDLEQLRATESDIAHYLTSLQ